MCREGGGRGAVAASGWALTLLLSLVLATGVLDGVAQGAIFVDAAQSGPRYTQVGE